MRAQNTSFASITATSKQPEMGVYVGMQQMEYVGLSAPYLAGMGPYTATGGLFSVAAGRLSFTYGMKGVFLTPSRLRSC